MANKLKTICIECKKPRFVSRDVYNKIKTGGNSGKCRICAGKVKNLGKIASLETREKLRKYHKNNPIKYWLGKIFSKKHLRNLSKAQTGRKHPQEVKDKIRESNLGKIVLESTRKKQSDYWKGRMVGDKNPNWQGGKSFEPYAIDWTNTLKRSIRERDFYTCQICKEPQGDIALPVHHIDYNKKNNNPNNLITLCKSCHSKTNYNRRDWIKYFNTTWLI